MRRSCSRLAERRAGPGNGGVSSRGTWRSPTAWTTGSWLGFLDAGRPHWQDYRAAADQSAVLACAVPEPSGSAVLFQEIYAEDYRGAAVTFRGQLRTTGVAGQAGLHLAAGRPDQPPGALLRDRGGSSLTGPGSTGWTWHEVTVPVPEQAGVIRFGISLTGRGRVELRNPELTSVPEAQE